MSEFAVGERVTVKIREIISPSETSRKLKILCDIPGCEWDCSLQFNPAVADQARLFRVGDSVDGWVIRRHERNKFLAIGISDFGRFPPKPDTLAEYIDALLAVKSCLKEFDQGKVTLPAPEAIAVVKGMLNRSVKKDQWDWLFVYRAFGFTDDLQASKVRDRFVVMSDACKAFRKSKSPQSEVEKRIESLLAIGFPSLIDKAIAHLREEGTEWEAIRTPTPIIPRPKSSPSDEQQRDTLDVVYSAGEERSLARSAATQVRSERANAIHQLLVKTMASVLSARNYQPFYNSLIDLYCEVDGRTIIFEMKSVTEGNEVAQIRKAVSQLYEYRFLHEMKNADLVVVLNREPSQSWVVDYLVGDRNIFICWSDSDAFNCPSSIREHLAVVLRR